MRWNISIYRLATCVLGVILSFVGTKLQAVDMPQFSDQTAAAGLTKQHQTSDSSFLVLLYMTPGLAAGDLNDDGFDDLIVGAGAGQNVSVFINQGDGTFVDEAISRGIDLTAAEVSAIRCADIDGDGYIDIYVGTMRGRNYCFFNQGDGTFVDVGVGSILAQKPGGQNYNVFGTTFGDTDLDGDLDLVTADWTNPTTGGNNYFRNDGNGVFVDITSTSINFAIPVSGFYPQAFTPTLIDLDGDRYPDLPFVCDFTNSQYHRNNTDGTFVQLAGHGAGSDENGMGSAFGDIDNDGDFDWFVTSIYDADGQNEGFWGLSGNRLFRNEGNHTFLDITDLADVRDGGWGWGTDFGDFNNDGLIDLTMTNGQGMPPTNTNPETDFNNDPTKLWLNTGNFETGPIFIERAAASGLIHTSFGKGLVTFDADNDGDLDIAITSNRGEFKYFRNDYNPDPGRWIEIDLNPLSGIAPHGIGSRILVTVAGTTYHRYVVGSSSFMSQSSMRTHIGFPETTSIDSIEVAWADGSSLIYSNVSPGQILELPILGDMNCDLVLDSADIVPFALCLVAPEEYALVYSGCDSRVGDLDRNGVLNGVDIERFISVLISE